MNNILTRSDILADLHTHTIFSQHAHSTVKENIEEAKRGNLKYLAVTDHYFGDGTKIQQKNETTRIKYLKERVGAFEKDINILSGAEFNLNQKIPYWNEYKDLDWKLIGLHSWFADIPKLTINQLYERFRVASEKEFNAFAHIERELHKVSNGIYSETACFRRVHPTIKEFLISICDLAKKKNIFLEVNEFSLVSNEGGAARRLEFWLNYAKENGNLISLGTDAHYYAEIGKFDNTIKLLNKIEFPKERILNCNKDLLKVQFRI